MRPSGSGNSAAADDDAVATTLLAWNAINFSYFPEPSDKRWCWQAPGDDGALIGQDDEAFGVAAALGAAVAKLATPAEVPPPHTQAHSPHPFSSSYTRRVLSPFFSLPV